MRRCFLVSDRCLPQSRYAISVKGFVSTDDGNFVCQRLSNEQTVKRVAVMKGQSHDLRGVCNGDIEYFDAIQGELFGNERFKWLAED